MSNPSFDSNPFNTQQSQIHIPTVEEHYTDSHIQTPMAPPKTYTPNTVTQHATDQIEQSQQAKDQVDKGNIAIPLFWLPLPEYVNASLAADALNPDFRVLAQKGDWNGINWQEIKGTSVPNMVQLNTMILMRFEMRLQETVISMLDGWIKSIKDVEEQRRLDENSPVKRQRRKEELAASEGGKPAVAPVAIEGALLALGMGFVGQVAQGAIASATTPAVLTVIQSVQGMISTMLPLGLSLSVGISGAFLTAGMVWSLFAKDKNKGENGISKESLNQAYASQVLLLVRDPGFNESVALTAVDDNGETIPLSDKELAETADTVRLGLLATAFAAVK